MPAGVHRWACARVCERMHTGARGEGVLRVGARPVLPLGLKARRGPGRAQPRGSSEQRARFQASSAEPRERGDDSGEAHTHHLRDSGQVLPEAGGMVPVILTLHLTFLILGAREGQRK